SASIHLLDRNGYPVLATGNLKSAMLNQDDVWAGAAYPQGTYLTSCIIPKNFLNEGLYYISVILLTDIAHTHVQEDELVSFSVHDTGEMRGEYMGGWIGMIRPRLEWHTEPVQD
ncbi:MAG: hypothetical protein LUQ25_09560, partial [Methanoregulaceae archaeon]|nr:hypothetical protein [Methanoregulaceae archaeon]